MSFAQGEPDAVSSKLSHYQFLAALDECQSLSYPARMHELAIAESLLEMAGQELRRRGLTRLLGLRVRCGALAGVMPEALEFAFAALLRERGLSAPGQGFSPGDNFRLEVLREPLQLCCAACGRNFEPAQNSLFCACPLCGYEFFHQAVNTENWSENGPKNGLDCAGIYFESMEAE